MILVTMPTLKYRYSQICERVCERERRREQGAKEEEQDLSFSKMKQN